MSSTPDPEHRLYAIPGGGDADCDHDAVHELGADGGANRYFECPDCGSVLVREGRRPPEGRSAEGLGTVDPRLGDLLDDIDAYHDGTGSSFAPDRPESTLERVTEAWRRLLR
ncbi:hypothetical protein GJ631_14725 [Natronomonas sp. CBA1123]|uniref:hypothetical protein n=1 Tax=Natronomonas sp. CBA1123 TaxID=2668070 RepID=UPI0012EADDD1|nr:hypothetical protein [Natronomonas sp. CBA1123]MUV87771.1 hypothetical protein [Natronomonas sp. CBA1123]